ncbi:TetR/AcrR family transcriptional regulator [Nocardia cerradoensis]|uniref:Putative HTH-type transcriptional regulator n=1 Tax=Nocardia cerradoensis TaxID=85688 RepID=A0A231H706_9NOCA|nr:TetR/AcrR family transcriptional regulator [Nocardia cerradoensis]NKY47289.1 TetR/AcrR family transcriptional regulator [Nocardia cerradoensis]OXR44704.1 putative HTH-type transcriptional regulator [Nocardia cerradoensis]
MSDWLAHPRSLQAAERILDAAASLFSERGVNATQMGDIAKAAGCSRATLYRYFDNRQAVQLAYVHREARRVGARVTAEIGAIADPGERAVAGVLASLRAVRSDPLLIAWFRPDDAGATLQIAQTSEVIEAIARSLFATETAPAPDEAHEDWTRLARWLTRIIVSLLTVPGRDEAEERDMLERFIAPLLARAG